MLTNGVAFLSGASLCRSPQEFAMPRHRYNFLMEDNDKRNQEGFTCIFVIYRNILIVLPGTYRFPQNG